MKVVAMLLPMPREPEWRTTHTRSVSSRQTSTKWLPEPRVPSWRRALSWSKPAGCGSGLSFSQRAALPAWARWESPLPGLCSRPTPAGMEREKRSTRGVRSRGSALRFLLVRTAIMPQPMSTPTAAGMRVSAKVGMTLPTVAPLPRCASGMSATCPAIPGARESMSACLRVTSSRMLAQFLTFAMGVGFSLVIRGSILPVLLSDPFLDRKKKNIV